MKPTTSTWTKSERRNGAKRPARREKLWGGSRLSKIMGEREGAGALSRFHRVRRGWSGFCSGKGDFPMQKLFPCSFRARKSAGFQRKLDGVARGAETAEICGFAKGKTVTAQIENLKRGAGRGYCFPSTSLSKPFSGKRAPAGKTAAGHL